MATLQIAIQYRQFQIQSPGTFGILFITFSCEGYLVKHFAGPDKAKTNKAYGQIPAVPDGRPAQT